MRTFLFWLNRTLSFWDYRWKFLLLSTCEDGLKASSWLFSFGSHGDLEIRWVKKMISEILPVGQPLEDHCLQSPVVLPFTKQCIHFPKKLSVVLSQSPPQILNVQKLREELQISLIFRDDPCDGGSIVHENVESPVL